MRRISFILYFILPAMCIMAGNFKPSRLRCEYLSNPICISERHPQFSWIVSSDDNEVWQSNYELLISDNLSSLRKGEGNMWNTGIVNSDESIQITYEGKPLKPFTRYYWKVRLRNQVGKWSDWSEIAWFETTMLDEADWKADWIGDGSQQFVRDEDFYKEDPMPLFRKEFSASNGIRSARLYVSGLGYYEAYMNGKKVGDHVLDPGWTAHRQQVLYSVYDVTSMVAKGRNVLAFMLGNGWYNPLPIRLFGTYNLRDVQQTGRPIVKAELRIEDKNGRVSRILTDAMWKVSPGPIVRNNVYLGEKYDARLEVEGWNRVGTPRGTWRSAVKKQGPSGSMTPQMQPPVKIIERISPFSVWKTSSGTYMVDMGVNFAGVASIKVKGEKGRTISMRYGENIHPDSTLNWLTTTAGHIKSMWNMQGGPGAPKDAYQEDKYVLKGIGEEVYTPKFTFHGFRYVEVFNYPGTLSADDITGIRLSADLERTGFFECSDSLYNRLHEVTLRTFRSNVFSVQSDCPGREKMGYGGDMVATAESFIYNFDMAQFYRKTVKDFINDQSPAGGMPEIAPNTGIIINGIGDGSGPLGWQLAFPFVQKQLYDFYGDKRIIERCYDSFTKQVEFINSKTVDGLFHWDIGDHVALDTKDDAFAASCFYYEHVRIIAYFAEVLGRKDDAIRYEKLAEDIRQRIVKVHLLSGTGRYGNGTQGTQAFGLYYNLSEENKKAAFDWLVKEYERHDWHVATGIFSCKMAFDVFRTLGRNDLAGRLVSNIDYPGWGYMLEQGATTLWESWEYPENGSSQNHPMFGSTEEWFFRSLLGINSLSDAFKKIEIKPQPTNDLKWAKGSYSSIRGQISSDWSIEDGLMRLSVSIPANTSAIVYVPSLEGQMVETTSSLSRFLYWKDGYSVFEVPSGTYTFRVKPPSPHDP